MSPEQLKSQGVDWGLGKHCPLPPRIKVTNTLQNNEPQESPGDYQNWTPITTDRKQRPHWDGRGGDVKPTGSDWTSEGTPRWQVPHSWGPVPGRGVPTASGIGYQRGSCLSILVRWKASGNPDALLKGPHADSLAGQQLIQSPVEGGQLRRHQRHNGERQLCGFWGESCREHGGAHLTWNLQEVPSFYVDSAPKGPNQTPLVWSPLGVCTTLVIPHWSPPRTAHRASPKALSCWAISPDLLARGTLHHSLSWEALGDLWACGQSGLAAMFSVCFCKVVTGLVAETKLH